MRLDIYLRSDDSAKTIKFYVDELGFFTVAADYGMDCYLLRHVQNAGLCLQTTSWHSRSDKMPHFALSVANCDVEFKRLSQITFDSGGSLVKNAEGIKRVFEWPGGKSFMLEDPSGNLILLFEDYIAKN